jgi:hypothetical protein
MGQLNAQGVAVDLPRGWEGRIFRRPAHGDVASAGTSPPAAAGATTHAVVQLASVPLSTATGDFGSGVVEQLGPDDALIVVFEYDAASARTPLFQAQGLPRALDPDAFSTDVLQRTLPNQAGVQVFFTESGRPCCLYVVLGRYANRHRVVPSVNAVLRTIRIDRAPASAGMPEPPSSASSEGTTTSPSTTPSPTSTSTGSTPPPSSAGAR